MRGISALLVSVWIMVLLSYFLLPNSTASAAGATPNVFEILSYGGDITFIQGSGTTKMTVVGPPSFIWADRDTGSVSPDRVFFLDNGGNIGRALAPVEIPDGATITGFECALLDNSDSSDMTCILLEHEHGSLAIVELSALMSSGKTGIVPQFIADNSLSSLVDRDSKDYQVVFLNDECFSPGCAIISAKITYTVPSGMVVGGEFYPVDNVSLVLAYGLVNSWWMAPIGIGIGVGIYLVKRRF